MTMWGSGITCQQLRQSISLLRQLNEIVRIRATRSGKVAYNRAIVVIFREFN